MRIGDHDLDDRVFVMAEIGNNHEGSVALAEELIGLAAEAGADAVKLQTIEPELLVSPQETERVAQLTRFRLDDDDWPRLAGVAADAGVAFLSTPFSLPAVAQLDPLVPAFKIASGDNDFVALLEAVARTSKPIVLSTGMSDLAGVERSKAIIDGVWQVAGVDPGLVLVQCTVSYPTAPADANLAALRDLAGVGATLGYSDHTIGVDAAALSVALGARLIEKHFTIDKAYSDFRDHQLSADPPELAELVRRVREAEVLLGPGGKRILDVEAEVAPRVRRGIAAAADLEAGHVLGPDDLTWLRPATGLRPGEEHRLLGHALIRSVRRGDPLGDDAVLA